MRTAARLAAALLLAAMAYAWGLRVGYAAPRPWEATDYDAMTPAELSWVAEGIQERMSDLLDDLAAVQRLQATRMAANQAPERG